MKEKNIKRKEKPTTTKTKPVIKQTYHSGTKSKKYLRTKNKQFNIF